MKKIILICTALSLASCSSYVRFSSKKETISTPIEKKQSRRDYSLKGHHFSGKASFYADKFHGRKTANGERFDQRKLTAAHKTLPFGTIVEVENLRNGNKVLVTINDRGPFIKGRIIDLSKKAAQKLDMIRDGVVDVKVKIIS